MPKSAMRRISVIIPLYNEKESLVDLHRGISEELRKLDAEAEMIFVNDGSTDGSEQVLRELQQEDPRIRIIRFRRNFGNGNVFLILI